MSKIQISYASKSEHNFAQRLIINTIERATGRKKLEKLYSDYSKKKIEPVNFWSDAINLLNIQIINSSKNILNIPSEGPLIIIANHPFGIIDGLILCSITSKFRKDFKILTHETLQFIPELNEFILPIEFNDTDKEKIRQNIITTQKARKHLNSKGALIIFPSGSVSVARSLKSAAKDDEWKLFPAKLIQQTKSNVLPIFFDGKNGFLFHLFASKLKSPTLKYSSYIHETRKKIGKSINIYPGNLIRYSDLENIKDRKKLTNHLKKITYNLKDN